MSGLLPCPFCGGEAVSCKINARSAVICRECEARAHGNNRAEAIAAWNRRTSASPADAAEGPAIWVSEGQLYAMPPDRDEDSASGRYLPMRRSPGGNFQFPLYSATALERITRERDEARAERDENFAEAKRVSSEYHALGKENLANHQKARAAEAKLAEARKVIEPFAAIYDRCIPEEPELRGPILNAKPDEKALAFPLVHDLRAARRFLEETK